MNSLQEKLRNMSEARRAAVENGYLKQIVPLMETFDEKLLTALVETAHLCVCGCPEGKVNNSIVYFVQLNPFSQIQFLHAGGTAKAVQFLADPMLTFMTHLHAQEEELLFHTAKLLAELSTCELNARVIVERGAHCKTQ